ncbi:GNAT family N-acetyltransferase [Tessaracoccus sp. OH4464_COT-324]|uniref:GNAT family N-acetyltransferase n=1 Tax=Tessaracoccus sp. OH4464_COT-324 TaxID=2491059 RepID=UPI000F63B269|nr:GNAT family N-acetyltransferase [Tessaracoccus sp. OH4464_COT-324]RRD45222.1 GNAT family N-acetyltransferase [Tessaracoccus sp. OH4464_COT-324]
MRYEFRDWVSSAESPAACGPRSFYTAAFTGFHDSPPPDTFFAAQAELDAAIGIRFRTAHPTGSTPGSLAAVGPVATFAEWLGEVNVGRQHLKLLQISQLTVLAAHRRRGLMRRLMLDSLATAKSAGVPLAGLTAAEATIYGRFGFAPATFRETVEIKTKAGRPPRCPGHIDHLDREQLPNFTGDVFRLFHDRQAGSVLRRPQAESLNTGHLSWPSLEPDKQLVAAGHWDEQGTLDGYVTYKLESGAVKIVDLIGVSEDVENALLTFLASFDLIERIEFAHARPDSMVRWLLDDTRRYRVKSRVDFLWLRVLDPARALAARQYSCDDALTLRVVDPLGHADGTWRLTAQAGVGACEPTDARADVELAVGALGATLLGAVSPTALHPAGQVSGTPDAIRRLGRLLSVERQPLCLTGF